MAKNNETKKADKPLSRKEAATLTKHASTAAGLLRSAAAGTMDAARAILAAFEVWSAGGKRSTGGFYGAFTAAMGSDDAAMLDKGRVSQLLAAGRMDRIVPCSTEGQARRFASACRRADMDPAKADPAKIADAVKAAGSIEGFIAAAPEPTPAAKVGRKETSDGVSVTADNVHETLHDIVMGVAATLDRDGKEGLASTLETLAATLRKHATATASVPPVGKAKRKEVAA
jgi:predicted pyridoxine 5'-phosphate oxidase superfamily flavin-nucleotide-binding protein